MTHVAPTSRQASVSRFIDESDQDVAERKGRQDLSEDDEMDDADMADLDALARAPSDRPSLPNEDTLEDVSQTWRRDSDQGSTRDGGDGNSDKESYGPNPYGNSSELDGQPENVYARGPLDMPYADDVDKRSAFEHGDGSGDGSEHDDQDALTFGEGYGDVFEHDGDGDAFDGQEGFEDADYEGSGHQEGSQGEEDEDFDGREGSQSEDDPFEDGTVASDDHEEVCDFFGSRLITCRLIPQSSHRTSWKLKLRLLGHVLYGVPFLYLNVALMSFNRKTSLPRSVKSSSVQQCVNKLTL